jgi:hypothetical protein
MFNYQIHRIETAPETSKPLLQLFTQAIGFVPNLAGAIANSPVLANSLSGLFKNVHGGSFTEAQVQVLLLTNAVTNSSSWPVAFHTTLGLKQLKPWEIKLNTITFGPDQPKLRPGTPHVKDALERKLHKLVCAGQLDLKIAQVIGAYRRLARSSPD